jgi:hypothetical protein
VKQSREIPVVSASELESACLPPTLKLKSALGRKLVSLRAKYIAQGGKLSSPDEISEQLGRTRH